MLETGDTVLVARRRLSVGGLIRDRTFRLLWIVYCGAAAADCLTTARAVALGLHERNPLARWMYHQAGMASLWAAKVAVLVTILVGLSFLPRRVAAAVTAVFAITAWLIVWANLAALASG
jgi:hypothetical protein